MPAADIEHGETATPHIWVPGINDYCIGCGACVKACPHACLKPIWDFATLVNPEACTSGGDCIDVCEDDAIHMKWVPMEGEPQTGEWCIKPPELEKQRRLIWPFSLFAKKS